MQTAYALEACDGATGLYADPRRRRFLMVTRRLLEEGEIVTGATESCLYAVTWALSEMIAPERPGGDAATVARYQARMCAITAATDPPQALTTVRERIAKAQAA